MLMQDAGVAGGTGEAAENIRHGDAGGFGEQKPEAVADSDKPRRGPDLVTAAVAGSVEVAMLTKRGGDP